MEENRDLEIKLNLLIRRAQCTEDLNQTILNRQTNLEDIVLQLEEIAMDTDLNI